MALELRPFSAGELDVAFGVATVAFGGDDDTNAEREGRVLEFDRSIGVYDEGRMVATAGAYTFELTVPGGAAVPAAGVTWVAVLPTHRRRGILRQMMEHQLADVVDRGEPVAVLTASEGSIYRRFGYGVASESQHLELDAEAARLLPSAEEVGTLELVDAETAAKVFAEVYDRFRATRPGAVSRNAGCWTNILEDEPSQREGAGIAFHVVHHGVDGPDGYLRYRIKQQWQRVASHQVIIKELRALTPEVEAALWQYALDVDLSTQVVAAHRPIDDPLPWRLADPRRLTMKHRGDWLWARILDPARVLSARGYADGVDGALTVGVRDGFASGWADGRFRLEVADGAATCERVDGDVDAADIALDVADLGSLWMGAVRASTLRAAGRLVAASPAALALADRLFAVDVAPWCDTAF